MTDKAFTENRRVGSSTLPLGTTISMTYEEPTVSVSFRGNAGITGLVNDYTLR